MNRRELLIGGVAALAVATLSHSVLGAGIAYGGVEFQDWPIGKKRPHLWTHGGVTFTKPTSYDDAVKWIARHQAKSKVAYHYRLV